MFTVAIIWQLQYLQNFIALSLEQNKLILSFSSSYSNEHCPYDLHTSLQETKYDIVSEWIYEFIQKVLWKFSLKNTPMVCVVYGTIWESAITFLAALQSTQILINSIPANPRVLECLNLNL